jgi:hypothetical protein
MGPGKGGIKKRYIQRPEDPPQGPAEGSPAGVDTKTAVRKKAAQSFEEAPFCRMREGDQKAPFDCVLEFPHHPWGLVAQNGRSSVEPQIRKAPVLQVKMKVPGPEHRRKKAKEGNGSGKTGVQHYYQSSPILVNPPLW